MWRMEILRSYTSLVFFFHTQFLICITDSYMMSNIPSWPCHCLRQSLQSLGLLHHSPSTPWRYCQPSWQPVQAPGASVEAGGDLSHTSGGTSGCSRGEENLPGTSALFHGCVQLQRLSEKQRSSVSRLVCNIWNITNECHGCCCCCYWWW